MTQTIPLSIALGAANTGLSIGYRVLELDRTEYSAFTTTDVAESAVAGTYYVEGGIAAPDAGGYVVVGTDGGDYAEAGIEPAASATATVAISATQAANIVDGELAIVTHNTFRQALTTTDTHDLAGADKLWLAIKRNRRDEDANSIIFIEATAGLTVLEGAAYATPEHGALVVTGEAGDWTITASIEKEALALLTSAGTFLYEVKALVGDDTLIVSTGAAQIIIGLVKEIA